MKTKVSTIRGSSIDQLRFAQILAHAQATPGKISQSPGPLINNVATDAVTLIPTNPAADAGYTREVLEISRLTHFPLLRCRVGAAPGGVAAEG